MNSLSIYNDHIKPLLCEELQSQFSETYLHGIFEKSIENMIRMETLCHSLASRVNGIETGVLARKVKDKHVQIRTFMMHYLSRGSITPILCEAEKSHRSPFDYTNPSCDL